MSTESFKIHYPTMIPPGYGVGDIIAISQLAVKVYTAYQDAPKNYRCICGEVKSLEIIINKAILHIESTTLSDDDRREGQEVLQGCQSVLEDLNSLIEKYNLASVRRSQIVKRVKLSKEDITTLRARLISNTNLLNGFIQGLDIPIIYINIYHANTSISVLAVRCMRCVRCVGYRNEWLMPLGCIAQTQEFRYTLLPPLLRVLIPRRHIRSSVKACIRLESREK